jgi:hypothetical protein
MEVRQLSALPPNLTSKRTYETRYLYTGFRKYDTERSMVISMEQLPNGMFRIHEAPYKPQVISRVYHTEHVRVDVYQESPRIWSETLGPHEVYFFEENPQH